MLATRIIAIALLTFGFLAASGMSAYAQAEAGSSNASEGCGPPFVAPGVYDGVNDFDGADQAFRVVVPQGYEDRAPVPLIIFLAAGGGSLESSFGWWQPHLESAEGLFVVAEQTAGTHKSPSTLVALIDQLATEYCLDARRVHAMGNSSSVATAIRLGCAAPDRIGSVFVGMQWLLPCAEGRPAPMMVATGDPDRPAVMRSIGEFVTAQGCSPEPLSEDLGAGVTRSTYQDCEADLVLFDIEGVGHGFVHRECEQAGWDYCYPNEVFDLLTEAERFFGEHPLPE